MEEIGARIAARWLLTRGRENVADLLPGPVLPTVIDKELLVEAEEEISRSLRPYEEARRALRDGFWARLHREFGIAAEPAADAPGAADAARPRRPRSSPPAAPASPDRAAPAAAEPDRAVPPAVAPAVAALPCPPCPLAPLATCRPRPRPAPRRARRRHPRPPATPPPAEPVPPALGIGRTATFRRPGGTDVARWSGSAAAAGPGADRAPSATASRSDGRAFPGSGAVRLAGGVPARVSALRVLDSTASAGADRAPRTRPAQNGGVGSSEAVALRRLLDVALALGAERRTEPVLRVILDAARDLAGARYAALGVPDGAGGYSLFLTAGVDAATWARDRRAAAHARPARRAAGVPALDPARRHPRRPPVPRLAGRAPGHAVRSSACRSWPAGRCSPSSSWPTRPDRTADPGQFTEADQRLIETLSAHAALAVANAQRTERARELSVAEERARLARELHDSVTQTLFSLTLAAESAAALAAGPARTRR